ncbi:MAG: hypothetical protein ABR548_09430 [Actinomycetota bacterium]|nr:hypothetical protein [Actinomycetota bacterium]
MGTTATVYSTDLSSGDETALLKYEEAAPATHSQNYWEEMPPSVALSHSGTHLAYVAADGLYVFDREGTATRLVISRRNAPSADAPSTWVPPIDEDTYSLHSPSWSADDRYISFEMSHYEGSTFGFYDLREGAYFQQAGLPFSYADPSLGKMAWAVGNVGTIVPATHATTAGFYLSAIGDPGNAAYLNARIATRMGDAVLSEDAGRIAFTFSDDDENDAHILAVEARDGRLVHVVDRQGAKISPAFDASGNVWWVEGSSLLRWDGTTTSAIGELTSGWRWKIQSVEGGTAVLLGTFSTRARIVQIDTRSGEERIRHDCATDFTTYLGLV